MEYLLGYACGIGAGDAGCKDGPIDFFKKYPKESNILFLPLALENKYAAIAEISNRLAAETHNLTEQQTFFRVLGGDHTCAIGTWSGVASAIREQGDLGLIWIDAHFDSHTPESSLSGNIHGMPVATLLGYGDVHLKHIADILPKIKPQNLCMIGMRSFESPEVELIQALNIKVFYMPEVIEKGFENVFLEAKKIVTANTVGYGISMDLDGLDPIDAPAVGTPEEQGISAAEILSVFKKYATIDKAKKLLAFEIAEYNPHRDIDHRTEKLITQLLEIL